MKKNIPVYVLFVQVILLFLLFTADSYSQAIPFTILHFNDSHSQLNGTGGKNFNLEYTHGGFDRVASIIKSTRSTDSNVMVFHMGDFSTGSFFFNRYFGVPELMLFKRFNFDAIALGNHEFDLGPAALYSVLSQSFTPGSLPVLSANLNMSGFPLLSSYVTPYNIKIISGVKIGMFGLTIPDPSSNPFPVVISDSILQIALNTVQILQSNGCNVIICLSHLGYLYDSQIAANIPGVHIILGGHDHSAFPQPVPIPNPAGFNTLVCQAGGHYEYAGKMIFLYNSGNVTLINYQLVNIDSSIARDDSVRVFLDTLKLGIVSKFGNVFTNIISSTGIDIAPSFNPLSPNRDTPLGNFVTDAQRNETKTQIALTAVGLMAETIYKGPVTGEDLMRVVPYGFDTTNNLDFRLVKFSITGSELLRGLETVLWLAASDISYLPQSSGLTFDYNSTLPLGQKIILSSMRVNDTLINLANNYSVTVNEGLYKALTLLGIQVTNTVHIDINEYTSLVDLAGNLDALNYVSQGRMKDVSITSLTNPITLAKDFELFQNYPNPFNSISNIKYNISKTSFVTLRVFDITGRIVAEPVNSSKQPGTYQILFDAGKLSSGVYFYQLSINNERLATRKMLLIK